MQNNYFAAKPVKECVQTVLGKAEDWYNFQNINGLLHKIHVSWRAYHGAYYDNVSFGHEITFDGEQGEYAQVPVNHYRNIAQHLLVMTTSSRPAMEARATNTDYKSLVQTYLANGILDYYMREKDLESYIRTAVEYAIVMGAGYIKLEWDSTAGEVYDYETTTTQDPNTGEIKEEPDPNKPLYEGDVRFTNLSPFDVVFDSYREDNDHDWVILRSFKNKYDLAAKYPEKKREIEALKTKDNSLSLKFNTTFSSEQTDLIPVYEFFHKRTDSMPSGRYVLFLSDDIILFDGAMPYRMLPIIRIAPSNLLGSPYGYTPMFDIIPLQEAANSLYSTILTNQNAFGVQNVYVPRGADITIQSLAGGLNVIEGNSGAGEPKPLNLTNTPTEVFKFLEILVRDMETLSGVNSVARGNPEASLKSGAALALVQSLALQFASNLQAQYVKGVEQLGTALIKMLQDFAVTKRAITLISGKSNRSYVEEFSSDDISNISRVVVDVANPLSRTTSGKLQLAESLLQYGLIKDPQQYLTIVNTGKLEVATEDNQHELLLIRAENERLISGKPVVATALDSHSQHIMQHKSVLSDPELRNDANLVQNVLAHIQEHINLLKTVDPTLLQMVGQQSLAQPPAPPQAQVPPSDVSMPPGQGGNVQDAPNNLLTGQMGAQTPRIQGPGIEGGQQLPSMPKVSADLLVNPELQQAAMGNVRQ